MELVEPDDEHSTLYRQDVGTIGLFGVIFDVNDLEPPADFEGLALNTEIKRWIAEVNLNVLEVGSPGPLELHCQLGYLHVGYTHPLRFVVFLNVVGKVLLESHGCGGPRVRIPHLIPLLFVCYF